MKIFILLVLCLLVAGGRNGKVQMASAFVMPTKTPMKSLGTVQTLSTRTKIATLTNPVPSSPSPLFAGKKGAVVKNSLVKGKIAPFLSKFLITPAKFVHIGKRLALALQKDFWDLALILMVHQGIMPLSRYLYAKQHKDIEPESDKFESRYKLSKTRRIAAAIQEVAQLLGLLFGFEMGLILLDELGFEFVRNYPVYQWICGVVASAWGARNLSEFKNFVLTKGNRIQLNRSAGRKLISQFMDVAIYGSAALLTLDFLSIQMGFALKSLFGLSTFLSLVFSLASKELASEFLASLAIQGTNMYAEGEKIMLQDGTTGVVQKLGWLNTHLRRSDELVLRIPNTQISGKRVANISRSRFASVKQALAVSHDDLDKVPNFIDDVKSEIRKSCPSLIEDGSRSFQVFFTEYKDNSVEVLISFALRIRPFTEAHNAAKQDVLLAIRRAAQKNGVKYSYVAWPQGVPID